MIVSISVAVIAGLFLLNTIFLISVMIKTMRAIGEIQRLLDMVRLQIAPIIHDVTQILIDIRSIVRTAEKEMVKVEDSISAVRDTTRNIREFEALIQERIERPLLDLTAVLSAVTKGGKVFWRHLSDRK